MSNLAIRPESNPAALVEIRNLSLSYRVGRDWLAALHGVSVSIQRGETLAIVGESGSGKSTLANAIMGLLPENAQVSGGELWVAGQDLAQASEHSKRQLRGRTVGLVPQDPLVSLNPTMRIGQQIAEALIKAKGARYPAIDADVVELLEQVGLDRAALRARQYPHELSGGMRQRVLIAIALAGNPALIIADEPTSALDVTVQRKILDHLARLVSERGISLLIITHDLGVAADRADRVLVMQRGHLVEQGAPQQILVAPQQDYTKALIAAAPALKGQGRLVIRHPQVAPAKEILRLEGVGKDYPLPRLKGEAQQVKALEALSVSVFAGQTLAIVGESGSGKTTALRIALGLEKPSRGKVLFEGHDITQLGWRAFRPLRRRIQLVQQNPFAALDPRFSLFESIVEPLVCFGVARGRELEAAARRLITQVQLPVSYLERRPHQLSGGQRQRVAIARALALQPELLLLDEPVSALDVSVQAQILELLDALQQELKVSYVLVSHDLSVVASVAHQVLVLRHGQVIEQGTVREVFEQPRHPYTQELLEAVPGRRRLNPPQLAKQLPEAVPARWPLAL